MDNLNLTSPDALATAVPYLLGYQPSPDSTVVVFLDAPRVVATIAVRPEHGPGAWQTIRYTIADTSATRAVVVAYGDHAAATDAVDTARRELALLPMEVAGALRVDAGRLWCLDCDPDDPCDVNGDVFANHGVAANLTFQGLVAYGSREDIVARLTPVTGHDADAMQAALDATHEWICHHCIGSAFFDNGEATLKKLHDNQTPDVITMARVGVFITDSPELLVQALAHVEDDPRGCLPTWIRLMRYLPDSYRRAAATVTAWAAYLTGNSGVIGLTALDIAIDGPPTPGTAVVTPIVHSIVKTGRHPDTAQRFAPFVAHINTLNADLSGDTDTQE